MHLNNVATCKTDLEKGKEETGNWRKNKCLLEKKFGQDQRSSILLNALNGLEIYLLIPEY